MKHIKSILSLVFILALEVFHAQGQPILGFDPEGSEKQLSLETLYESKLDAKNLDTWMKRMAARPHYVGTEYGKELAEWMAQQFKSWGYDTRIERFDVLFPYPRTRLLELTAPGNYQAKLAAVAVEGDDYTNQGKELLPSYNAFSTDGDVEAELVFVNYGVPGDYEKLEELGIDVKGKVVIAKYYGSWRGIKPKLAAEKGAIGCIIYSDPQDDGYVKGDVYPKGAFKNSTGVQRGSVMDMPLYPGDVLTPGYGATKDAKRLEREDAPTITKIPVLPISYEDAKPLLEALDGPVAPESWRGGLPITYHIGPGLAKVHLKLEFEWELKPAYNVIAMLQGSQYPDQWVLRGNHHDAWVHGASDPVSGMVALMEEARVIGELARQGHRPRRSVVYAAWDAEEPGLIGSTEWVETHIEELKKKAVAYINTDGNSRGFFHAGGSHTLETLVKQVAESVSDPQKNVSIKERKIARQLVDGDEGEFSLYALGSGSDYTPFIQHAGIASLNIGFGGEGEGGEYHTIYDTYNHYTRFKDPEFQYGRALANTAGRIVLRMANASVLPFDFDPWFTTIEKYQEELQTLTENSRKDIEKFNTLVERNAFELATDPKKPLIKPVKKEAVPYLDFSPLQNVLARLKTTTETFSGLDEAGLSKEKLERLNRLLMDAEAQMTRKEGLPRRDWYKHQLYAPGFYTGYGVKTMPGVREAIEQKNWAEAQEQIHILAEVLAKVNSHLQEMTQLTDG
jgi:N-acetylated-alpha-linked acidic dipeptidase